MFCFESFYVIKISDWSWKSKLLGDRRVLQVDLSGWIDSFGGCKAVPAPEGTGPQGTAERCIE